MPTISGLNFITVSCRHFCALSARLRSRIITLCPKDLALEAILARPSGVTPQEMAARTLELEKMSL